MGRHRKNKRKSNRPKHSRAAGRSHDASPASRQAEADTSGCSPRRRSLPLVFGLSLVAASGLFGLWWYWGAPEAFRLTPRPLNVVLVTADTLRADKLGCYGNRTIETPHLDRLAESGLLFENAFTSAPITLPAHASIFTGTYPIFHGVRDNGGYYLAADHVTLAESLEGHGYATGAFVGAFVLDSRWGLDQGFEHYFDEFDVTGVDNARLSSIHRPGDEVLEEALSWMESVRGQTFFSWIHLYDPHTPYDPPEPYRSQYQDAPWGGYDGEVAYVDSLVGKLVDWLEASGLRESTMIVFVGDHGESLGDHEELTHGFFVYDATMQVPFILSAPYASLRGRRVAAQVRTIDLMPTVLELVGVDVPDPVQGESLVALATGRANDLELVAYGESIFPQHYGWAALASLRTAGWHFIEAPRPELYDLEEDPREEVNLARTRAGTVRKLQERLEDVRGRFGASDENLPSPTVLDGETRDRLAALGYVGGAPSKARTASAADPKDKIGLFKLIREAATDSDAGKSDQAVVTLGRVIAEDPGNPEAYHLLGNLHLERGETEQAVALYQEALALDSEYKPAIFSLALAYKDMGRFDEAAAGFERILQLEPRASQASFMLARIQIEEEKFREALATLESVEEPGSAGERAVRHNLLAECYLGLEQIGRAEAEIETALRMKPDLAGAQYNRGVLLELRGNAEAARAAYRKELKVSPESFRAHFNLAKLLGSVGRQDEAIEHLEKSIAINPRFIVGHLYLANAYLERGELERAMKLAKRGIELGPDPSLAPFGHFILADVYQRLGRPRDAGREMALAQKLQKGS